MRRQPKVRRESITCKNNIRESQESNSKETITITEVNLNKFKQTIIVTYKMTNNKSNQNLTYPN